MSLLLQVDTMKKAYHTACKEEKLATSRENNSKMENNNPEAQKKLQDKVEKCQHDVQKVCVGMSACAGMLANMYLRHLGEL